jgi:tetratricopeptide (TPR) repeat protein
LSPRNPRVAAIEQSAHSSPYDLLLRRIRDGRVAFVLGAGFSALATVGEPSDNPARSWSALILDGIGYVETNNLADSSWVEAQRAGLCSASGASQMAAIGEDLLAVLDRPVASRSGARSADLMDWLEGALGSLRLNQDGKRLTKALDRMGPLVVTTNYDELLEQGLGRRPITLLEPRAVHEELQRTAAERRAAPDQAAVIHLHGTISDRSGRSIVLGHRDYDALLSDDVSSGISRSMFSGLSFVFVGVGDGQSDPHFKDLQEWAHKLQADHLHFSLVRGAARAGRETQEAADAGLRLRAISYGDGYDQLPAFVESLAKAVGPTSQSSFAFLKNRAEGTLGRDTEIEALATMLRDGQTSAVSVTGGPGIGKSTVLAGACSEHDVRRAYGAIVVVDCFEICDIKTLTQRVDTALALESSSRADGRPDLVLCENFERLARPGVELHDIEKLLCSETARYVFAVRGGKRPASEGLHIEPLGEGFMTQLFLRFAGQKFAEDSSLSGLVELLGGIPLAAKALARGCRNFDNLAPVVDGWNEILGSYEGSSDSDEFDPRRESVTISLDFSWKGTSQLPPLISNQGARAFLLLCAAFPEGIRREDRSYAAKLDAVSAALETGFCSDLNDRFSMLAPIREYLQVQGEGPEDAGWSGPLEVLDELAMQRLHQPGVAVPRFSFDNAAASIARALRTPGRAPRAAEALEQYVALSWDRGLSIEHIAAAAELLPDEDVETRFSVNEALADAFRVKGLYSRARGYAEDALEFAQQTDDVPARARLLRVLANIVGGERRYSEALGIAERGQPLADTAALTAQYELTIAYLARRTGNLPRARLEIDRLLERLDGDDPETLVARADASRVLSEICREQSMPEDAVHAARESLRIYESLGSGLKAADAHRELAEALLWLSDHHLRLAHRYYQTTKNQESLDYTGKKISAYRSLIDA